MQNNVLHNYMNDLLDTTLTVDVNPLFLAIGPSLAAATNPPSLLVVACPLMVDVLVSSYGGLSCSHPLLSPWSIFSHRHPSSLSGHQHHPLRPYLVTWRLEGLRGLNPFPFNFD